MKWMDVKKDGLPTSKGLYGALLNDQRWNPDCFTLVYWNGEGWVIPSQSELPYAPYRNVQTWCILEIGKG